MSNISEDRLFPIQAEDRSKHLSAIPWSLIQPHEPQALKNHCGQTLERLAERHGLSACEAVAVILDKDFYELWKGGTAHKADGMLRELVNNFKTKNTITNISEQAKELFSELNRVSWTWTGTNGSEQALRKIQSTIDSATKPKDERIRELEGEVKACHDCWDNFTEKVCAVIPEMKNAPLFQQAEKITAKILGYEVMLKHTAYQLSGIEDQKHLVKRITQTLEQKGGE